MNYYISDLHLFANSQTKNGKNFDNRPFENVEEMNSTLSRNLYEYLNNKFKVK